MRNRAYMQRLRNAEVRASSLLTTIFEQTPRGVQYQLHPLDSSCGFLPITKIHKLLLDHNVIASLNQINVIKIVNKFIQIHNLVKKNLCNLLADQSI